MHRTLRSMIGTAACALALTLAAPAAAHADTQTAKDPRGDVETGDIFLRAAAKRAVDIVGSTNRYQGDTLRLSLELANLPATNYEMTWLVRAGGDRYLGYYSTTEFGSGFNFYPIGQLRQRGISCQGLDVSVDRDTDRVTMRVPASCFGATESVRVAAGTSRRIGEASQRVDDARRNGFDQEKGLKFGPVLERS